MRIPGGASTDMGMTHEDIKFSRLPKGRQRRISSEKAAYRSHCMRMKELVLANLSWNIFSRRAQESHDRYMREAGLE